MSKNKLFIGYIYCLFSILMLLITSCYHSDTALSDQLTGSWENYNYITTKPNAVGENFTTSYNTTYQFDDGGKGNKTEKQITTMSNGENSSYTIEYPFNWTVKKDGQEAYTEIKYLQGNIKNTTGKNIEEQEQKARNAMLATNGSTETIYYHIEDNRKLICHEKGDTATWYYVRKAE